MNQFDLVQLLKDTAQHPHGELQINHGGVTWNIGMSGSKLHYAFHSLQSLEVLEQLIQKLGFEAALPNYRNMVQENTALRIVDAIGMMLDRQILNAGQIQQLLRSLAEDSLEVLLWTNQATFQRQDHINAPASITAIAIDIPSFAEELTQRLTAWQTLPPTIGTPYQCPRCDDFSKLQQPVHLGVLPQQTLEMMARLMQGITIRQLAFLLKQDVLKLCQLLSPYIKAGVLRLEAAQSPYNQLPTISSTVAAPMGMSSMMPRSIGGGNTMAAPIAGQPKYKVVCIDDSPTVLDTIQRYLGTENFEVATVENPMASLSALFDMKPNLILMDVSMPGIDGNRLCQILKRSSVFTNVPIIMVSGNTGVLDKEKAKAAGATDYLTKPFSKEELLGIVNQYLNEAVPAAT